MKQKPILIICVVLCAVTVAVCLMRRNESRTKPPPSQTAACCGNQSQPKSHGYDEPPVRVPAGQKPGTASVRVGEKTFTPANYSGHFQRIAVPTGAEIPVAISWPKDDPATTVSVQAVDGGLVDGKTIKNFDLGESKSVQFMYYVNTGPGGCQVLLRRGTTEEVLQFWVPLADPQRDAVALR